MSDLLQEIDDAIKREKAQKFWQDNGPYMIGGALALVILTAGFTAWNSWQLKQNTKQTNLLVSAMETPYPETALGAAAQALDGSHKAMAQLQAAGHKAKENETEALALYRAVAADGQAPELWQDLATLMAVRLEWNAGATPDQSKKLYGDLKPLLAKNNPWHLQAALQAAMIAGDGLGDYRAALDHLAVPLNAESVPPSLKERARALDHFYAMKHAEKESAAKAAPGAEPKG